MGNAIIPSVDWIYGTGVPAAQAATPLGAKIAKGLLNLAMGPVGFASANDTQARLLGSIVKGLNYLSGVGTGGVNQAEANRILGSYQDVADEINGYRGNGLPTDIANYARNMYGNSESSGALNSNVSPANIGTVAPTATPATTATSTNASNPKSTGNGYKAKSGGGKGLSNPTPPKQPAATGTAFNYAMPGETFPKSYMEGDADLRGGDVFETRGGAESDPLEDRIAALATAQLGSDPDSAALAKSRYDQLMQDYALSEMADGGAIQRYMAQQPAQYGEDIGTLYDMLYGRN